MTYLCMIADLRALLLIFAASLATPVPVQAHPHVFVDGNVDFVLNAEGDLTGLSITWRYDPFETLYLLANTGILPQPDGTLLPEDRKKLIKKERAWPEDFQGAAHLSLDGTRLPLSGPKAFDADLEDGRLVVRFRRFLDTPVAVRGRSVDVALYERTYYYAFTIAAEPQVIGDTDACEAALIPFEAAKQHEALQATLAKLSREETPDDTNVGALFADKVVLACG
ncbi:MAG: DUF1007 family protein [Pseudomonadota bacterium]